MKYFFEVYLQSPEGVRGWDIETGTIVNATTRMEAVGKLKRHYGVQKFDEIIQLYEVGDYEGDADTVRLDCELNRIARQ